MRHQKNGEAFFDMREGVTLLTAAEYKQTIRKIGFQQSRKKQKIYGMADGKSGIAGT